MNGLFTSYNDVMDNFEVNEQQRENITILLAWYSYDNYSGDAFVLFIKPGGKMYEVNASHCSCYGLENQWNPEETTTAALRHRAVNGMIDSDFSEKLINVCDAIDMLGDSDTTIEQKVIAYLLANEMKISEA